MAKVEDGPGFETFGSDVKAAREALNISRRALTEQVSIDPRYLANIELSKKICAMEMCITGRSTDGKPIHSSWKGQPFPQPANKFPTTPTGRPVIHIPTAPM